MGSMCVCVLVWGVGSVGQTMVEACEVRFQRSQLPWRATGTVFSVCKFGGEGNIFGLIPLLCIGKLQMVGRIKWNVCKCEYMLWRG